MKMAKICLAAVLVLSLFAGCRSRDGNDTSGSVPDLSEPGLAGELVSGVEEGIDDLESRIEEGISGFEEELDISRDESSGESSEDDEDAASAMSTDFGEIGALDGTKKEWGSGGPTDDEGRSNGAVMYQERYGQYDAWFIAPSSEKFYLTFDEGYEQGYTSSILDTLQEKDAKAVFFVTLPYVKTEPELVQRMIDEGHVVGNHSTKHLSFPDMPLQDAAADIMELHEYMKANYGYEMYLFRPPMGHFSEQTLALAQSLGYKSIFWSFAYKDYDVENQPLTLEALNKITDSAHRGEICLLHAVSKTNAEVLADVIDQVREQGLTITTWDIY